MSAMKRYLEDLSVEMGFEGEINEEVMAEGQSRLEHEENEGEAVEVATCAGCGRDFCYAPAEHSSVPDLCKLCATVALEEGLSSYAGYVTSPDVPFYADAFRTAVPFPNVPPEDNE